MTTRRITGTIPLRPITYARTTTVNVRGKTTRVNPAAYRHWRDVASTFVLAHRARAGTGRLTGPLIVEILVGPDGVAYSVLEAGTAGRPRGVTGDIDNYAKALLDTLVDGGAIEDDAQVEALTVRFTTDPIKKAQI